MAAVPSGSTPALPSMRDGGGSDGSMAHAEAWASDAGPVAAAAAATPTTDADAVALADAFKAQGNRAFRNGKHADAVELYTRAIDCDATNHVLYCNRAAAYLGSQFGDAERALADCERSIALRRNWYKSHFRKGIALQQMGRAREALFALETANFLDRNNAEVARRLETARREAGPFGNAMVDRLRDHPVLGPRLASEEYMAMIALLGTDAREALKAYKHDDTMSRALVDTVEYLAPQCVLRGPPPGPHDDPDSPMLMQVDFTVLDGPLPDTPLHVAARENALKKLRSLFRRRTKSGDGDGDAGSGVDAADANVRNAAGSTPLHLACAAGHLDSVAYLCEEATHAGVAPTDVNAINKAGGTPLLAATNEGHLDIVRYLVDKAGADPLAAGLRNETPLYVACREGQLGIVMYLSEVQDARGLPFRTRGAPRGGGADGPASAPLWGACEAGHADVVQFLVAEVDGVDVNRDVGGGGPEPTSPLLIACQRGHDECVRILCATPGIDVNRLDDDTAPLYAACANNHLGVVHTLCTVESLLVNRPSGVGRETPLMAAAQRGHAEVVDYLVRNVPALDVLAVDAAGTDALLSATLEGHVRVVRSLMRACAGTDAVARAVYVAERLDSGPLRDELMMALRLPEASAFDVASSTAAATSDGKGVLMDAASSAGATTRHVEAEPPGARSKPKCTTDAADDKASRGATRHGATRDE